MVSSEADDVQSMLRLAAGDSRGATELYDRHGTALYRYALAMCRSRQAAEDLVHDAFVAIMHQPEQFRAERGSVLGYLCGVLRHRISKHFRRERRWLSLEPERDEPDAQPLHAAAPIPLSQPSNAPEQEFASSQIVALVRQAVLDLPLLHREVIVLCDLEELPYDAVAEIIRAPIGTVRSRLHRARALLTIRLASLEALETSDRAEEPEPDRRSRSLRRDTTGPLPALAKGLS
jgi:RNA polymerase sigma-70 factor, ECF subfamily